jgi:galactose mutarotase-like enzyme
MSLDATDALHDSYPFDFRFEATYRLVDAHTLDVALTTTNRGATPLPYYAGHHFYFALPHGERAQTTLELPPTQRHCNWPTARSARRSRANRPTASEIRRSSTASTVSTMARRPRRYGS